MSMIRDQRTSGQPAGSSLAAPPLAALPVLPAGSGPARAIAVLIPVLCVAVGLVTRLHGLGAKPFWLDEVTTLHRSALPLGRMILDSLSFHHLPAYFVVSSWFLGLGHDEAALRLPAALFGALSCGLAARAATSLAGNPAGLLAGMLMATAPIEVQYGQEARSYTLVICLVLVALIGLIGILRASPAVARPGAWLAYAAGTAGGLLVLGVAISWFIVANLVAVATLRGRALRRWAWVQLGILLVGTPGFVAMVFLVDRAHGTFESGLDWIPPLSWGHLRIGLESLYMFRTSSLIADRLFDPLLPGLGIVVIVLAFAGLWTLRHDRRARIALAVGVVALPVGTMIASAVQPMFMPRYVLWSTGPFLILVGTGIAALPRAARMPVAAALSLAAFVNLAPYYQTETKPRWEVAAELVTSRLTPGDVLLIDDAGAVDMMNVFLARRHQAIEPDLWTKSVADASCVLSAGHRVWALQGRVGQRDHESLTGFLARIAPLGPPAAVERIGLDIMLMRFDHPAGPCVAQG